MVARAGANRVLWKAWWLGCSLALTGFSARAEAPPPPAEFWNYLLEFGDAEGDVFDPNDLALATHVQEKSVQQKNVQMKTAAAKKDAASGQPNADSSVEQQREIDPASAPVAPAERSE